MGVKAAAGEQYTIRRKFFKLFGAGFFIDDAQGNTIGYCKQRAFRIREDLRVYTDESGSKELLRISTKSVFDISGAYDIFDADGQRVGTAKRKGLKSLLRDEWELFGPDQQPIGLLVEDSGILAILRRLHDFFALISPQKFVVKSTSGQELARFRQHFNPFFFRLGVSIKDAGGPGVNDGVDELFLLAVACIVSAIEGRQG